MFSCIYVVTSITVLKVKLVVQECISNHSHRPLKVLEPENLTIISHAVGGRNDGHGEAILDLPEVLESGIADCDGPAVFRRDAVGVVLPLLLSRVVVENEVSADAVLAYGRETSSSYEVNVGWVFVNVHHRVNVEVPV